MDISNDHFRHTIRTRRASPTIIFGVDLTFENGVSRKKLKQLGCVLDRAYPAIRSIYGPLLQEKSELKWFRSGSRAKWKDYFADEQYSCRAKTVVAVDQTAWIPVDALKLVLDEFSEIFVAAPLTIMYSSFLLGEAERRAAMGELMALFDDILEMPDEQHRQEMRKQIRRFVSEVQLGPVDETTNEHVLAA